MEKSASGREALAMRPDHLKRKLQSEALHVQRDLTELESQIASGEIPFEVGSHLRHAYQSELEATRSQLDSLDNKESPSQNNQKSASSWIVSSAIILSLAIGTVSHLIQTSQGTPALQMPDSMTIDSLSTETLEAILLQYDLESETPDQVTDELLQIRFVAAERRFNEGRLDLAFDHYDRIIRSSAPPNVSAVSLTRLAWIVWVGNGEPEPALELLDRSLELMPNSIDALYMQGRLVWCGLGDIDQAAALFKSLLRRNDLDPGTRELVASDFEAASHGRGCE